MSYGQDGDEELDEAALRALVARAADADPDAWEAIYRRSHPRVRRGLAIVLLPT